LAHLLAEGLEMVLVLQWVVVSAMVSLEGAVLG